MMEMLLNEWLYLSTTNLSPSKPTKVNSTAIPNPNRLSATLMSVDKGEGKETWFDDYVLNELQRIQMK